LNGFVNKYYPKELNGRQKKVTLAFQPLTDVHLNEDFNTYKSDALTRKDFGHLHLSVFLSCLLHVLISSTLPLHNLSPVRKKLV
jgi:hypothetical protein